MKLEQLPEPLVAAARAASGKQARGVVVLEVGEVLGITDWFVICEAGNPRHVKTVVEAVESEVVSACGLRPRAVEGRQNRYWVLMDYGDFVVHVFQEEARRYYGLERLWADVPRLEWEDQAAAVASGSGA